MTAPTAPVTGPDPAHGYFAALGSYLELGMSAVEGWLSPTTAAMLARMLVTQVQRGVRGDVCEIGVHHGKLFIVLANATVAGETAVAVDVFDQQEKNLDQSGRGDRAVFERNVAAYAPDAALDVVQDSSLDLHRPDFLGRRFRFVSIDGGHTAEATANDLWLAEKTLAPGGLVALDDILSAHWTGVLTGLVDYTRAGGSLVPCALLPNKLLLARDAAAALQSRADLQKAFPLAIAKTGLEFLGNRVESYNDHPYYSREARAELLAELADLRRQMETMTARAATREQDIAALRQTIQAQTREHGQAADLLREQDDLRRQLDAMSAKAAAHARQAAATGERVPALQSEIERLQNEVAALHGSTSWRSTAPLRALSSLARRRP